MQDPSHDPRLAPIANPDGTLNPDALQALFDRSPHTLTPAEREAVDVDLFEMQHTADGPLATVSYTEKWLTAFVKITGGTITREKLRNGETVQRSVRRYRGRNDV